MERLESLMMDAVRGALWPAWTIPALLAGVAAFAAAGVPVPAAGASGGAAATAGSGLRLIRNATMKIRYAGYTLLTDPMFSRSGELPSFAGIRPNPTVDLPAGTDEILAGVQAVFVSHRHPDHLDEPAVSALLARDPAIPVFCSPADARALQERGFRGAIPVEGTVSWEGIAITRVGGRHGFDGTVDLMGPVSGFVLSAPGEPVVYWAGDTVLCPEVVETLRARRPDVVIVHAGGAETAGYGRILMDAAEAMESAGLARRLSPRARTIAVHAEALDHCRVTRAELRRAAVEAGIPDGALVVPNDGERVDF